MKNDEIFIFLACIATVFSADTAQDGRLIEQAFNHTVDFILDQFEKTEAEMDTFASRMAIPTSLLSEDIDTETCKDKITKAHCRYLKRHFACTTHKERMGYYCNRTCEFCQPKVPACKYTPYGCCHDEKTPAKGYEFQGCPESCIDKSTQWYCRIAQRDGLCADVRNKNVRAACKKTCALCRPCEDEKPLTCRRARQLGLCLQKRFSMMNDCRKTCGFCGKNDRCGSITCPANQKCIIDPYGEPSCICSEICKSGDDLTGLVCARNGIEYPNLCALKQASCKGPPIKVKQFGPCKPWTFMEGVQCHKIRDHRNCKAMKRFGYCKTMKNRLKFICPHTCGFCGAKAAQPACHYSKYGCCMDNKTPCTGPNYEGCKNSKAGCQDKKATLCKRYRPACGDSINRKFMQSNCAKTCYYCKQM